MATTNEKIKEILSLLNQIRNNIGSVVVYQKEVILVRTIVISSVRAIMKSSLMTAVEYSPNESKEFRKFKNTLQGLHDLVRMLSGDIWTSVALEWEVQKPTKDLFKYMQKMSIHLQKLGIEIPKYSPTDDDINADYLAIYKIFQSANGSEAKVTERLNSISKYLIEHGVELPPSPESAEIRTIFAEIPQFHVDRDDFILENQIGRGSSGIVYKAKQKSTGNTVAVKELTSMNLDKYEVASLRREVVCLSSVKYKYLIDFIGATTTSPYWIVTTFMPGNSLFARLKEPVPGNGLDPNQLTIIAYEIAEGMAYLHSKNIIHRDLKTLNILLDEKNEPRICDFGISRQCDNMMTGLVGTFNYMAPEIIAKTGYNLKADVFSFGMMLWEMIKKEIPFNDLGPMNAGRAILNGQRPQIPRSTPKPLQQLIKDCWQFDIERRPSFVEILSRMRKEIICFSGADQNEMKKFYLAKADEYQKNEKEKKNVLQTISMREKDIDNMTKDILNIPLHEKSENDSDEREIAFKYTDELIGLMNCQDLVVFFLQNKGIKAILMLFKQKNNDAPKLLMHVLQYMTDEECKKVFTKIMKEGEIETAEKIVKSKNQSINFTKLIEPFIQDLLGFKSSSLLNYFILKADPNIIPIFKITDAIGLHSFDAIERLINYKRLEIPSDFTYIHSCIISSSNSTEQLCSTKISLCFNEKLFHELLISNCNKLISSVFKLSDIKTIGQFLYRACQYEEASKTTLANETFLKSNLKSPYILMIFIQISRYHSNKIISSNWFLPELYKQLQERVNIEIILRICGVLSINPAFSKKTDILNQILVLLKEDEYSSIEIPLVIGIFSNVKFDKIDVYYPQFLSLASQNSPIAGKALCIISNIGLPAPNSRQCARLLDAIEQFYEKGIDNDGIAASCKLIRTMSSNDSYRQIVSKYKFEEKINKWVQKLENPHLTLASLSLFELFGYKAEQKTLFAAEEACKKIGSSNEKFLNLIKILT